ncbi:MAG: hypothetical protein AAF311_14450 [Pseudomonadota bacterium]
MSSVMVGVAGATLLCLGVATWKAPRLTSVTVWALLAAIFLTAALLMHMPGSFSEKALWATLGVPVLWVGLQFWTYWDRRAWRATAGLIALTLLCAILVFTTTPSGLSAATQL